MNNIKNINIDLGDDSYDISISSSNIQGIKEYLNSLAISNNLIIITDDNVAEIYLDNLSTILSNTEYNIIDKIIIPAGEKSKNINVVNDTLVRILAKGIDRKTTIIAFGGGVIGDLAGFVASIALRGINLVQIPTSLLAQIDSSVGGKTGINTESGKNLIGSFYQPKHVLIDIDFLNTLDDRQLKAGYAEMLKYAVIDDLEFFEWLEDNGRKILSRDKEALIYAISKCCQKKADIVKADEKENGIRASLNLGHTFGHALELKAGYGELLHGEAVAIGMLMATRLSIEAGFCQEADYLKLYSHLEKMELMTEIPFKFDPDELYNLMLKDKKILSGKIGFILIKAIGESFKYSDLDKEDVISSINSFLG